MEQFTEKTIFRKLNHPGKINQLSRTIKISELLQYLFQKQQCVAPCSLCHYFIVFG